MEDFNSEKFWGEEYWAKYIENKDIKNKLELIKDDWVEKYREIFNQIKRGKALDLGSGIGQDTMFLMNEGYDVISADISEIALNELKNNIPKAKTIKLDMCKLLPFDDEEIDLVFANLSTHFYNWEDTIKLYKEIKRILKKDGYFVGRVNSTKAKYAISNPIKIEENYYFDNKYSRHFAKEQLDKLFEDWKIVVLNENTTERLGRKKNLWEFIVKK